MRKTSRHTRTRGRYFCCPNCENRTKIPLLWIAGVESVFICKECRQKFKTGYKTGALLFALAMTAAVATANMLVYIFSSVLIPIVAILFIPLWITYGFYFRRWWLLRKSKKLLRKNKKA